MTDIGVWHVILASGCAFIVGGVVAVIVISRLLSQIGPFK